MSKFIPLWQVKNTDYLFDKNGNCQKYGKPIRRVYNNGCRGYYINGKFQSLVKLRKDLIKFAPIHCPF